MKTALFSDIHANLPAFEAFLDDLDKAAQAIEYSPLPDELAGRLRKAY